MVHITNGDSVAETLRRWAGEPRLIVWRDALHEWPVRAGLTLEEQTAERMSWWEKETGEPGEKLPTERDRQLRRLVARDSLWLWFEDDLYDQLQLLQILNFLHHEGLAGGTHFLIDIPRGLAVEQAAGFAAAKVPVTPAMVETAVRAWAAFTSADPAAVPALLQTDLSALPHLRPAIERLIEHYPDPVTGLNRIERTILTLLENGGQTAHALFVAYQKTEERPFLGDSTFFWYLDRLSPLVQRDAKGFYHLGPAGAVRPRMPRWVGGVHFS